MSPGGELEALINFYLEQDKVVKTLESVRDLQVRPEITQYSKLEGIQQTYYYL